MALLDRKYFPTNNTQGKNIQNKNTQYWARLKKPWKKPEAQNASRNNVDAGRPVRLKRCSGFSPSTTHDGYRVPMTSGSSHFDKLGRAILADMSSRTTEPMKASEFELLDEAISDTEMERFLAAKHDEIEAKLQAARESVARGDVAPLEPLPVLLRTARRHDKATR